MPENGVKPTVLRVAVGTPNENMVPWQSYENHIDLAHYLGYMRAKQEADHVSPRYEFGFYSLGRFFTPMAREELCNQALNGGFDYILMMDNDMLYPRDMFYSLVRHQKDIIAPLAFTRRPPYTPVMYLFENGYSAVSHTEGPKFRPVFNYPKDAVVRVDATGFGAVLIHTRVLKAMPKPWFKKTSDSGEDILFCLTALEHGFHTYVDTSIKTAHLGDQPIIDEDKAHKEWDMNGFQVERTNAFVKYGYVPVTPVTP